MMLRMDIAFYIGMSLGPYPIAPNSLIEPNMARSSGVPKLLIQVGLSSECQIKQEDPGRKHHRPELRRDRPEGPGTL